MTEQKEWAQPLVESLNQYGLTEYQETKKEKPQRFQFLSSLKAKYGGYFSDVWSISFGIGVFYGLFRLLAVIFNAIRAGDFVTFAFSIIFNLLLTIVWGFIGGIVGFVVLVIFTLIPYLIVRGFVKRVSPRTV